MIISIEQVLGDSGEGKPLFNRKRSLTETYLGQLKAHSFLTGSGGDGEREGRKEDIERC